MFKNAVTAVKQACSKIIQYFIALQSDRLSRIAEISNALENYTSEIPNCRQCPQHF